MSDQPQERWEKRDVWDAESQGMIWGLTRGLRDEDDNEVMLAWVYSEADADRIIADHERAGQAEALREALEQIAQHPGPPGKARGIDRLRNLARAALAAHRARAALAGEAEA